MIIRTATPEDHRAIWRVNALAFEGGAEPELVEHLRSTPDVFDPELDVVAEDDGQVVGHVLLTWVELTDEAGDLHRVLQLAPLAIHPRWQGRGIGGDLVREALRRAEAAGAPLVMLMGHPDYYPRFGFVPASDHGIAYDPEGSSPAYMVHALGSPTPALRGTVRLGPGFDTGAAGWPPRLDEDARSSIRALREQVRGGGGSARDLAAEIEVAHGWPARSGYLMLIDDTVAWDHAWNEMPGGHVVEAWADVLGDGFPGDVLVLGADDALHVRYRPRPEGWVTVVFTKYDERLHWHFTLQRLGEDEHGVWLGGQKGFIVQRGHEAHVRDPNGFVTLIPRDGSWVSTWNAGAGESVETYVDVTSKPEWRDDTVTMIDLDLDVIRRRDGTVYVDDEDEFAEHQVLFDYPPDVVAGAEAACAWLVEAVTSRSEPFGDVGPTWLARLPPSSGT